MRTTTTIGTAVCAGLLAMLAGCAARADGAGVGNAAPSGNAGSSTSISTTVAMSVTTALSTPGGDSTMTSAVPDGDPSSSRRSKPVGTDELAGRTYRSTAVSGRTLAEGTVLSLTFGRGALSATAGCNTPRGRYAIDDGRLTVGRLQIDKPKPCPSTVSEETSWLSDFLGSRPTLTRDGHRLTLATATTTIEFTDRGR